MIRIQRAKVGSRAITAAGESIPSRGWLFTIGRYTLITTVVRRPKP